MDQMVAVTMLCLVDYLISTLALGAPVPTELAGWDRAGTSCNFSLAMRDPEVTGWELELLPPMHMLLSPEESSRDNALIKVNLILETTGRKHGLHFKPDSLRTSVSSQISTAVSTIDGHSLVNSSESYPWKGPAFLRLRQKLVTYRGSGNGPGAVGVPPGSADLTLKLKDVDPQHVPKGLVSTKDESSTKHDENRKEPHLKIKVENDVYCSYTNRANYEAKWSPVPADTDVATLSGVRSFFRHVPVRLGLPSNMTLPVYTQREYSKSVWDMQLQGVRGVVNLILIFNDQKSSLAGSNPVKAELSFRLKRKDIERVHKSGSKHYYEALNTVLDVCNDLHDEGWDEDPGTSTAQVMAE